MRFSEAMIKYVAFGQYKNKAQSMSTYEKSLRLLGIYLRNPELESVTLDHIIEYLNAMKEMGYDERSFVPKCCAFKQFFTFFRKQDYKVLDPSLIPIPMVVSKFPKIIEEADYQKLLNGIDTNNHIRTVRDRVVLHLLWDTGVRHNELLSLNLLDMDLANMRATIRTEKSRGVKPVRMIFWTPQTNEILKAYINKRAEFLTAQKRESEALLVNVWSRWESGRRMSSTALSTMMANLSRKVDLGYLANPHRFRHRFGRNLALQGANNSIISDMMGHSSMESTRIYTVMNEKMMQEVYNKYFKS